mmetsp:Transcript_23459/g.79488  ORF Transcript_23459/g.79488 Transcript_23459/m.79488 type:complete len:142 (+) Transcript_23459:548-973(+)
MQDAKEEARANRMRILFGGPGGPSAAVGEWVRNRPLQQQQQEQARAQIPRLSSRLSCGSGAPPFSSAPCSILPSLYSTEDEEDDAGEGSPGFDGAGVPGHFWHRMQKMEVELLCNAVHLHKHRSSLDDVWAAKGGKPDDSP